MSQLLSHAFILGRADAWTAYGFKRAAEELRLKLPRREFHGLDAALRSVNGLGQKKADSVAPESQGTPDAPVEQLTEILRALPVPQPSGVHAGKDPLDRGTLWSGPSSLNNADALTSAGGGIV